MNLKMEIAGKRSDLNPKQADRLRRAMDVMCDIGFDIELSFTEKDAEEDLDMYKFFPGAKYPHVGHYIRMVKRDMYPI
jgi:hypothetical protein